jgi:hypothetical protein
MTTREKNTSLFSSTSLLAAILVVAPAILTSAYYQVFPAGTLLKKIQEIFLELRIWNGLCEKLFDERFPPIKMHTCLVIDERADPNIILGVGGGTLQPNFLQKSSFP